MNKAQPKAEAPKNSEKFDAVLVEAVSAACEHYKHPVKLSVAAPKPGAVGGPIADSVLVPAKKILGDLLVTHGPQAVDFVIDFIRSKIPY